MENNYSHQIGVINTLFSKHFYIFYNSSLTSETLFKIGE